MALNIAELAKRASMDKNRMSPFAKEVQRTYRERWPDGGKIDDIAVVVVVVIFVFVAEPEPEEEVETKVVEAEEEADEEETGKGGTGGTTPPPPPVPPTTAVPGLGLALPAVDKSNAVFNFGLCGLCCPGSD